MNEYCQCGSFTHNHWGTYNYNITLDEVQDMTLKSGNHFKAKKSDSGEYTCETCGGESFDYELFEAYGDEVGCLDKAMGGTGEGGNPKKLTDYVDVQRARKHIEDMKSAMERVAVAAEEAAEEFEEITEMAADGSVAVTYRYPTPVTTSVGGWAAPSYTVDYEYVHGEPEPSKPDLYAEGGGEPSYTETTYEESSTASAAIDGILKALERPVPKSKMKVKKNSWLDKLMKKEVK